MEATSGYVFDISLVKKILKEYLPLDQFEEDILNYVAEVILEDSPNNVLDMQHLLTDFLSNELSHNKEEIIELCKEILGRLEEAGYRFQRKAIIAEKLIGSIKLNEVKVGSTNYITSLSFDPKAITAKKEVSYIQSGLVEESKQPKEKSKALVKHLEELKKLKMTSPTIVNHSERTISFKVNINCTGFDISLGGKTLFEAADLKINFGRRYVLVGRNGIGKTTLLNYIARKEIPGIPDHIQILHIEQTVVSNDNELLKELLNCDVERNCLLDELDNLNTQLETKSGVETEITKRILEINERYSEINGDTAEYRAGKILRGLGFKEEDFKRPTKSFSGGWRMRINLAKALFCEPDVLLLDEPTNHLDMNAVMWLEDYLIKWPYTLIVVSHARDFINTVATDIINISNLKLEYWKGNYEDFEKNRSDKMKMLARQKESQTKKIEHIQKFVDKFRASAARASLVQSRIKQLGKLDRIEEIISDPSCIFVFPTPVALNPPILRLDGCTLGYEDVKILEKVSLHVDMSSRIAIVGPNGAGKTTLLKALTGELKPSKGMQFRHAKLRLAMFTQHHVDQLDLDLSPVENIELLKPEMDEEQIRAHLSSFGVSGNLALRPNYLLSGGQKTRVAFACLVLDNPQVIMMDEPTNHLDIDAVQALAVALNSFTGGLVIVSHDQHFVEQVCDQIYIVKDERCTLFKGDFGDYKRLVRSGE